MGIWDPRLEIMQIWIMRTGCTHQRLSPRRSHKSQPWEPYDHLSQFQFSKLRIEGLKSQNHCFVFTLRCPLTVQICLGLGPFFQIELFKTGRSSTSADLWDRVWSAARGTCRRRHARITIRKAAAAGVFTIFVLVEAAVADAVSVSLLLPIRITRSSLQALLSFNVEQQSRRNISKSRAAPGSDNKQ